MTDRFLSRI